MATLMEIWKAGARMPFIIEDPLSRQRIVISSYYWPGRFFEGEMNGAQVCLSPGWTVWRFIREA